MSDPEITETTIPTKTETEPAAAPLTEPSTEPAAEPDESFADALRAFEKSHAGPRESKQPAGQLQGTVVSLTADQVFLDVGYKIEGVLPRSAFENGGANVKQGDVFP